MVVCWVDWVYSYRYCHPRWICLILAVLAWFGGFSTGYTQTNRDPSYQVLWDQGEYREALDRLQEDIDSRPELKKTRAFRYVNWVSDRAKLNALIGEVDKAIDDLEWITGWIEEPAFYLRLAELYKTRGRLQDYQNALEQAKASADRRYGFHSREENLLAICKVNELQGENPKQLLNSWYSILTKNYPDFTAAFVSAGDLCRSKRAYDRAEEYYRQAMEKRGDNQSALEGMAETYWKTDDPRLNEILEQLMKRNPNSFVGIALQAELLLDKNDSEEAIDVIHRGLEINPNHLRLRGLKAAALFLMDQLEAMNKLQEKALEFNPHASLVYRIPGRIASRHYRFEEGVEFQEKAVELNEKDHEARALLGLDLLRLGMEERGRKELEKAFELDPFNVHVYNMLELLDSINKFTQIEEGPFLLQLPVDERQVLAQDALSLLTEAIQKYQNKYAIELDTPINVQIFDDHDDFMVRSLGLPGMVGFLGICFGKLVTMDSPSARPLGTMNWRSVLWHEFVHVITLQKTNNRMPRWLSEGISVYEETQRDKAWGQKMDIQYKAILENEELPGLKDMESYFTQPKTPMHLMLGYFLAGEFVTFYTEAYGSHALRSALAKIGNASQTNEALIESANVSLDEFDRDYKKYLEERLAPYKNLPEIQMPDEQPSIMERLFDTEEKPEPWLDRDSPFTNALREGNKAFEQKDYDTAEKKYKEAYELYPDYEGESRPLLRLTHLYQAWGKEEKLKETLYKEINTNATAFGACLKLLEILQEEEEWEEVVKVAHWAMGINPFDVTLRKTYLKGVLQSNQLIKALSVTRQLAHLDDAHQTDYKLQSIDLLMDMKDWNEAKQETVQLLENYPHFWEAQQRLLTIVERKQN